MLNKISTWSSRKNNDRNCGITIYLKQFLLVGLYQSFANSLLTQLQYIIRNNNP